MSDVPVLEPRPGTLASLLAPGEQAPDALNMAGDYAYLGAGYYASLDAELSGERVWPTTEEALDAYVVPILADKARAAGIEVPSATLVTERFPAPPFLAWPVNPFSSKGELILDEAGLVARRGGLTYAGKYAVYCQRLPDTYRLDTVRVVLGRCDVPELESFVRDAFAALHLPLARLRVIVSPEAYLLAAAEPLPYAELSESERSWIGEVGRWRD